MSEQDVHSDGEQLFDTDTDDAATDAAQDTDDTEESGDSEGEQEEALDLEIEEESKKTKAEDAKQKQVDAWQRKLDSGSAKLEDLPKNLQWLKAHLQDPSVVKERLAEVDLDAVVERKLAEKEENRKFIELKSQLGDMGLTNAQKRELEAEFRDLASNGVPKAKALKTACKLAGVDLEGKVAENLKQKMALPKPSYYVAGMSGDKLPVPGSKEFDRLPADKRVEVLERIRTNR
jgi:hypothetical protein